MKKLAPKPVHHLRRIGTKNSTRNFQFVKSLIKKTDIRVDEAAGFSVNIKSKQFVFSMDQIAKVIVPKPVQLSKQSPVQTTIRPSEPLTSQAARENVSTSENLNLKTPAKAKPSKLFMEFFVTDPSQMSPSNPLFHDSVSQNEVDSSPNELESDDSVFQISSSPKSSTKAERKSPTESVSEVLNSGDLSDIETIFQSPVFIDLCEKPSAQSAKISNKSPKKGSKKSPKRNGRSRNEESLELEICSTEKINIKFSLNKNSTSSKNKSAAKEKIVTIKSQDEKNKSRDEKERKESEKERKESEKERKESENKVEMDDDDDDCVVMEEICTIFANKMSPGVYSGNLNTVTI